MNSNKLVWVGGPKASRRLLSALKDEKVEYMANQKGGFGSL